MSHHVLLVLHIFAATIWVGGHTYLVLRLFPKILREKDTALLLAFERNYEPLGMSALAVLIITGVWMSAQYGVAVGDLFTFTHPIERVVSLKVLLLLTTIAFAVSAQTRVIPTLTKSPAKLSSMAVHATAVTLLAITMMVLGTFIRYGGL